MNEFFSVNINILTTKYPIHAAKNKEIMTKNLNYIYATVLFWLITDITLMSVCPANNIAKQQKATKYFEEQYGFTIPSFNLDLIQLLILSPRANLKKAELEKYSCINVLIKSLQTYIASNKKRQAKIEIFESWHITQDLILLWMRLKKIKARQTIDIVNFTTVMMSFSLCLDWSRAIKFKHQVVEHKKAHIEYKDLKLPFTETTSAQDP